MDDLELRQWKPEAPAGAGGSKRVVIIAALAAVGLGGLAVAAAMMNRTAKPVPATVAAAPAVVAADSVAKPAAAVAPAPAVIKPETVAATPPAKAKPVKKTVKAVSKKTVKAKAKPKAKPKPKSKPAVKKGPPPLDLDALSKSYKKPSRTHP